MSSVLLSASNVSATSKVVFSAASTAVSSALDSLSETEGTDKDSPFSSPKDRSMIISKAFNTLVAPTTSHSLLPYTSASTSPHLAPHTITNYSDNAETHSLLDKIRGLRFTKGSHAYYAAKAASQAATAAALRASEGLGPQSQTGLPSTYGRMMWDATGGRRSLFPQARRQSRASGINHIHLSSRRIRVAMPLLPDAISDLATFEEWLDDYSNSPYAIVAALFVCLLVWLRDEPLAISCLSRLLSPALLTKHHRAFPTAPLVETGSGLSHLSPYSSHQPYGLLSRGPSGFLGRDTGQSNTPRSSLLRSRVGSRSNSPIPFTRSRSPMPQTVDPLPTLPPLQVEYIRSHLFPSPTASNRDSVSPYMTNFSSPSNSALTSKSSSRVPTPSLPKGAQLYRFLTHLPSVTAIYPWRSNSQSFTSR